MAGTDGSVDERTETMGTGYVVGNDRVPLMITSSPVGGPLAFIRSEAAGLLQLLRDIATAYGRHVRLLVFLDCLVLLNILLKWGTHKFNPQPKEVVHFDVMYPLLLELQKWTGDIMLVKVKSHSGCLLNERADELADLETTADGPMLCPGPRNHSSLWLRIALIVREHAQQCKKRLPRDTAPNRSLLDHVVSFNIFRSALKRDTIFVTDLLHHIEGATVSYVIRRCTSAIYIIWLKCMTGTYPVHTYLKRVGLANSPMWAHCTGRVPETMTLFACVCPQFRAARTSAHNQVRQVIISSLFPKITDSNWTVFEETRQSEPGAGSKRL